MRLRGLGGPNLAALLVAIFLIACAEELWSRFVPAYVRALGGGVLVVAAYGVIKDLLDAVYQFPGGLLTDRLGYRRALVAFNALATAGYAAMALAGHWIVVLIALPLVMAWQSFSLPATFSLIGDLLPAARRSMAFAVQSIVRRVPIVVAPIVGGLIIARYGGVTGMRIAIVVGIAIALCALVLQARSYRDMPRSEGTLSLRELLRGAPSLAGRLKALLMSDIVVRFGQGIGEIFVVLYVLQIAGMSPATFGWLVGLAMAVSIFVYIPVARLADAGRREPWVLVTYVFFALFPLLVALGHNIAILALAFVAMGLREIGEPPRKAMIVDLARADRRSVDVGTYYLVRGLAVFPASLVGGVLWRVAPVLTFYAAALVALCVAALFALTVARRTDRLRG